MGLGAALAIQAGSTALGALSSELMGDPDVPDLSAEAQAEYAQRRRDLDSVLGKRQQELEATLAASGQTGSAGASSRQKVYGEFADAQADLSADAAKAVSSAEQEEERMRAGIDRKKKARRNQAIGQLVGGIGQTIAPGQLTDGEGSSDASVPEGERVMTTGGDGRGGGMTAADMRGAPSYESEYLTSRYGMA